jgi:hypothetical protein
MSIDFKPRGRIFASEMFDGRLKKFGVREDSDGAIDTRWLTDGRKNYLCVWINDAGRVVEFTRYMWCGDPNRILAAVAEAFETEIFSEFEPQYWGFETWEEMNASPYLPSTSLQTDPRRPHPDGQDQLAHDRPRCRARTLPRSAASLRRGRS